MDRTVSLLVVKTLRQIIRAVDIHSQHLKKTIGLTGPQLLLLNEIKRSGEIATGDLAKAVNLAQATVTSIIDRLEKKDLVVRNRSSEDKRRVFLTLTSKAQILLEASPSFIQDEFLDQFEQLDTWEQSLILSSLQRIAKMMNAHEIQAEPILTADSQSQHNEEQKEQVE
ncbi:MarR family winged helix-turn-helix transcriptional regulator [Spirochaeta lutea]|uniref:MarR family winged helix-turn-helix transcriptional regulator n=1 Tax=Spirochaeta lutea TaxID=1480694 RepID=UPI000565B019|nr:MarR family transcriptional regulator [Spirochaeta lutea]